MPPVFLRFYAELNDFLPADPRVECVMIAVSDGLTLARKRAPGEAAGTA